MKQVSIRLNLIFTSERDAQSASIPFSAICKVISNLPNPIR